MIIGLTGGSGTGKSTVSLWFLKKGYKVIDGDKLSRELTVKGSNLHINKLSVDVGELTVEGDISALIYSENPSSNQGGGFFSRVFR